VRDDAGPIGGAQVMWVAGGREFVGQTDARGVLRLPRGTSPFVRICASSADHAEACAYAHLDAPGAIDVVLVRRVPVRTKFWPRAARASGRPRSGCGRSAARPARSRATRGSTR
jgi:hypothetical protein